MNKQDRERYRRERPTPGDLAASGDFEDPVLHGNYLELRVLGDSLRSARLAAGWTLDEVASRAGVDPAYLSRLERGKMPNPTVDTLGRCAAAVGKRIVWGIQDVSEVPDLNGGDSCELLP